MYNKSSFYFLPTGEPCEESHFRHHYSTHKKVWWCSYWIFRPFASIYLIVGKLFDLVTNLYYGSIKSYPVPKTVCPLQCGSSWISESPATIPDVQSRHFSSMTILSPFKTGFGKKLWVEVSSLQKAHAFKNEGASEYSKQSFILACLKHKQLFAGNHWQHFLSKGYCEKI